MVVCRIFNLTAITFPDAPASYMPTILAFVSSGKFVFLIKVKPLSTWGWWWKRWKDGMATIRSRWSRGRLLRSLQNSSRARMLGWFGVGECGCFRNQSHDFCLPTVCTYIWWTQVSSYKSDVHLKFNQSRRYVIFTRISCPILTVSKIRTPQEDRIV